MRAVLDASDVLTWFVPHEVPGKPGALALHASFATYVAVADASSCRVVTADERMLAVAPDLTTSLAS